MPSIVKTYVRDLLPKRCQVPAKYWYSWLRGMLEEEMNLLGLLIRDGDRVIDVGGNWGVYAFRFCMLGARVEVFEPNPKCLRVLEAWAAGKSTVKVHPVALSNCSGQANLRIPVDVCGVEHDASASIEHDGFMRARDELVYLRTLDSFAFEDVGLIKVDVEGHEYKVIEGATVTLTRAMPALLVEIEQRHCSRPMTDVFDQIRNLGYQGFFMGAAGLEYIENFNVTRNQALENLGGADRTYINNFIFLHRRRLAKGEYQTLLDRRTK